MIETRKVSNSIKTDKSKFSLFLIGLIFLFLIVPFYHQPNRGGSGFEITFNIPVWAVVSWIIAAGVLFVIKNKQFIYPQKWIYFFIFPVVVIIIGLATEIGQPIVWFFRQMYILGGLLFLFVLFQYQPKQKIIDQILFVLVIATGLHALLGTMQMNRPELLSSWFPLNDDFSPRGMFQQINVHASFLATGLIVTLYLITRPSYRTSSLLVNAITVISFTLAVYVVVASGSRVGLLSLLLCIPLIVWSRRKLLRPHKKLLVILFVLSCCSFGAGYAGLDRTIDKTLKLTENTYASARVAMYTIGLKLVAEQPVHGYGVGGFLGAWNEQAPDFVARHPDVTLPDFVPHPHNETLLWMVEGGLLAFIGIVFVVVGITLALVSIGFQRGGAYAAMLIPISLHTQVELPFYSSSIHWFLWLFLIFLILRHQTKTIDVHLSQAATWLIQVIAVFFVIGVTTFMVNTARAQVDLYRFSHDKNLQPPYLQVAMNNIYYKPVAEELAMRVMLYTSIENKDYARVEVFETWAKEFIQFRPALKIYEELVLASEFLRPEGNGCDAIEAGLAMYPQNEKLQQAFMGCK